MKKVGIVSLSKGFKEFKLCYIGNNTAYFTTQALDKQTGDDWNDRPYDCNAGEPYEWTERDGDLYQIFKLMFSGQYLEMPGANYSVDDINGGCVSWLRNRLKSKLNIMAGADVGSFIQFIHKSDGEVYFPVSQLDLIGNA